jgi:hypothetical protein
MPEMAAEQTLESMEKIYRGSAPQNNADFCSPTKGSILPPFIG